MKKTKPFYLQVNFYLTLIAWVLTLLALVLYATNCPSEFNGGTVSPDTLISEALVLVCGGIAILVDIVGSFGKEQSLMENAKKYTRFLKYGVFVLLLYVFLSCILAEYSLLGTILYPIVSGTVGDPVDPVLSTSFFVSLIFAFAASIFALIAGLMQKSGVYKAEALEN